MTVIEDDNGVPWFEEDQIADVICKYYNNIFTSSHQESLQTVEKALQPCITSEINEELIKEPSPTEIKETTFAIHPDKAPGPDGFSASFFQANWDVVGADVIKEIQRFFTTGILQPSQNVTHVRLIPKIVGAKRVADYRPIALCNIYFKIISKLLSIRLKPVLHSIISENQPAFIPGRAISDNILITHEVLQYLKTSKAQKKCTMAVKTDMSKAYDRVEWKFIAQLLQRLGFHEKWINLIMQCVTTVSYTYLINDSVKGYVTPCRGIRQGDPLSPYLFILCGQVLSGLCTKAGREGTLQGVRVARGSPRVNHLLFADDTMFFCQASPTCCNKLNEVLWEYEQASGQKINTDKSSVTFSCKTSPEKKELVKSILGIVKEGGSGKYLGLPEHFGRRKKDMFTAILDKIRQRAASFSTSFLSKAGKLTMLKSVLTVIPTFSMSCFELPVSLCKHIQSMLIRFWWDQPNGKKKMAWVSWDKMTKPKAYGGLGFRDIQVFNQALLAKQAWRILTKPDSLLARVLLGKYCHSTSFLEVQQPYVCSHGWRSILKGRDLLKGNLGKAIGNGETTKLWKDSWISLTENIKPYGPIPEGALDLTVSDLLTSEMQWNKEKLENLLPQLAKDIQLLQPSMSRAEDRYIWQPLPSGDYTTRSGYFSASLKATQIATVSEQGQFKWVRDVWSAACSPKMQTFLLSIIQRALPLGENLQQRGMEVWKIIPLKQVVHLATGEGFKEAVTAFKSAICLPPTGITGAVLPWICWALWNARNLLIFENRTLTPTETASKGLNQAREWSMAQGNDQQRTKGLPQPRGPTVPNRRNPSVPTCKSDVAWDRRSQRAGLAWILTKPTGEYIEQGSSTQQLVNSPLIAEALALRSGFISARNLGLSSLHCFSDNATLIRAINSDNQIKEIYDIIEDIKHLYYAFVEVSFFHFSRSLNGEADSLAKRSLSSSLLLDPFMG
ncbi:uncharacterized protein LOC108858552 [Raphanus sativus]|uniref:Uncharacterized protein LOC108858552 n=1 Tax=Raphanus sativus TaxID=3726 RepID=A0A6J0NT58_RAPSA|nr:uncharacterized protein LOC108858552 [Raphanus sativus]